MKRPLRKLRTSETDLIRVFISSAQTEFQETRYDLKNDIEHEQIGRIRIFKVDLIEEKQGTSIDTDIRKTLEKCIIYVGIIGKQYSETTVKEFQSARSMGLPLLVYMFRRKPRSKSLAENDKMWQFLEGVKNSGTRIRGYDNPYKDQSELHDDILADLGNLVATMTIESAQIRKILA